MTSSTIHGWRKGDFAVAYATISALNNGRHINGIGARLGEKDQWMTIGAGQPFRVLPMRKTDIRHRTGIFEDDIEIHRKHLFFTIEPLAWIYQSAIKRLYPVDDAF